jgi:O-antigen/teichoic acid export membrane protein
MTGTTIAQAIPIAISPILTRIYTPEDFGVFALYISVASILSVVATGRYELAIMLPEKDEDSINIMALSIAISFFMSLIVLLIVYTFNTQITSLLGNPEISKWLYFIPLTIVLTGIYQSFNYWLNRNKQYNSLAINKIVQSGTMATSNLSMGLSGFGSSGLILSQILGQSMAVVVLGRRVIKCDKELFHKIKKSKMTVVAKEYIAYPTKSSLGALFNTLSYQMEYILFSVFFLLKQVGIYYFVNRIINIPKQFLSSSIWQSFLAHSQESKEYVLISLKSKQEKVIRYSILPMLSSLFVLPDMFVVVFGQNWQEATEYFLPLILAMHINFVVASFSLFVIVNRPDMEMKFNFILAFLKITGIYFSYKIFDDILMSVYILSLVQIIMFLWLGSWNYKQLGEKFSYFIFLYGKYLMYSLIPIAMLYWISLQNNLYFNLFAYVVVNGVFYKWLIKK